MLVSVDVALGTLTCPMAVTVGSVYSVCVLMTNRSLVLSSSCIAGAAGIRISEEEGDKSLVPSSTRRLCVFRSSSQLVVFLFQLLLCCCVWETVCVLVLNASIVPSSRLLRVWFYIFYGVLT